MKLRNHVRVIVLLLRPWPLPNNLEARGWAGYYSEDVPTNQKRSF